MAKVPRVRPCAGCDRMTTFPNRRGIYCSRACANRSTAKRKPQNQMRGRPKRTCESCGVIFEQVGGHPQRFCCRACVYVDRAKRATKPRVGRVSDVRSLIWVRDCKQCGRTFVARHPTKTFCTVACRVGDSADRVVSMYALAVEHGASSGRWRKTLCELLVERDGPNCGICGEHVNLNISSGPKGRDDGPSVDHVRPRSLGGQDALDNLRLTHWGCNRNRGNRGAVDGIDQMGRQTSPHPA